MIPVTCPVCGHINEIEEGDEHIECESCHSDLRVKYAEDADSGELKIKRVIAEDEESVGEL